VSGPVDVLAVMDKACELHANGAYADAWEVGLDGIAEVRAAVAELIEAIKPLAAIDLRPDGFDKRDDSQPVYARGNTVITVGDVRRASAALARAQGGAA
jgi:hypothetical protein